MTDKRKTEAKGQADKATGQKPERGAKAQQGKKDSVELDQDQRDKAELWE
jgi:hypothetical protein